MYFTEKDLWQIILWAHYRVAVSLGIIEKDELLNADAVASIAASKGHKDVLEEFSTAYQEWYTFHLKIYKSGKTGNLSLREQNELESMILRRDTAKSTLLAITE